MHLPRNADTAANHSASKHKKRRLLEAEEEKAQQNDAEMATPKFNCNFSDLYNIAKKVQTSKYASFQKFKLNIEAQNLRHSAKIDALISVDAVRAKLVPYNFQLETALQVINEMNGNAILADEVGLGKTIESGLIMKEMLLRGEVDSVLVVSPKSLLSQWLYR